MGGVEGDEEDLDGVRLSERLGSVDAVEERSVPLGTAASLGLGKFEGIGLAFRL